MAVKTIITINGCMGVGKTTLFNNLRNVYHDATYVDEPVEMWTHITDIKTGENLLGKYYEDKRRWSYTFQSVVFTTRLRMLVDAIKKDKTGVIVMDGSLMTDKKVYAKMLYQQDKMDIIEWKSYGMLWDFYEDIIKQHRVVNIYLRCPTKKIMARIEHRNRQEEKKVDVKYLESLQLFAERVITKDKTICVMDIECEERTKEYKNTLNEIIGLIGMRRSSQ